ncbi:MAG TPA: AtpZ/AtpI family protein [Terriglobia bacterium]
MMPRPGGVNPWAQVAFYTGLSFIIPVTAVAGYGLGWFLDRHLHTTPVLAFIGTLVGAAAGIIDVIRTVMRREKSGRNR